MLPLAVKTQFEEDPKEAKVSLLSVIQETQSSLLQDSKKDKNIADRLGILASGLCLIHCLLLPFILPAFEASSYSSHIEGSDNYFHLFIFPVLIGLAFTALVKGYRAHHNKKVIYFGLLSLLFISLGIIAEYVNMKFFNSTLFTTIGSIGLVFCHMVNIAQMRFAGKISHVHGPNCGCKK